VKAVGLSYGNFGDPEAVLKLSEFEVPDVPEDGHALVKLLASPIHQSDIGMVSGKYGSLPELPAFGGREGLGEVIATCPGREDLIGRRVRMPFGAWRSLAVASISDLFFVPEDVGIYQGAMAFINPLTAWMILHSIRQLNPGDWIIQNAANSAVGTSIIQIANMIGVKTINLVRNADGRRGALMSIGATAVFEDSDFDPRSIGDISGGVRPFLGLNSVGGESAMNIIKSMGYGGDVVTIGAAIGDKVRFPTREMIFNGVCLRGFWLDGWSKSKSRDTMQRMYDRIFDLILDGVVSIAVDSTTKLSDGVLAIMQAHRNKKNGKVLILGDI
jgi:NADPH:quinone reductase-like Zn-dependent oxidoreductase